MPIVIIGINIRVIKDSDFSDRLERIRNEIIRN